jgi:hypothetical protein
MPSPKDSSRWLRVAWELPSPLYAGGTMARDEGQGQVLEDAW